MTAAAALAKSEVGEWESATDRRFQKLWRLARAVMEDEKKCWVRNLWGRLSWDERDGRLMSRAATEDANKCLGSVGLFDKVKGKGRVGEG